MCGIWAIFGTDNDILPFFIPAYNAIKHRGPDAWRIENDKKFKNCSIGFHRLAIVDELHGMQPMRIKAYPHLWILCNGEIYNCQRLAFPYETKCDVEAIIHLYVEGGIEHCAARLDGVFAFCLIDTQARKLFLARDTFGVRPAFKLSSANGFLAVSSEMKGLLELTKGLNGNKYQIQPLPPATYEEYLLKDNGLVTFQHQKTFHSIGQLPKYKLYTPVESLTDDIDANIRQLLTAAVQKRLMAHRRIGCLLSGGLDSSLIAALVCKLLGADYHVQTFAIGLSGSTDIIAARKVAEHIKSDHHEVIIDEDKVLAAIRKVIYHLESYDITTIRASIGMYLLSEYIGNKTSSVVIFSGEGADEVAQGYIYFRSAPDAPSGDKESRRLLQDLYMYDVLRSDRVTAAHGLEIRVPFLDHQFTSYYLSLDDEERKPREKVEKYLLRRAFSSANLLPSEILWRPKEAFSDGVSSVERSLFQVLQDYAETQVNDEELQNASTRFPFNTPQTKESYFYRIVFEEFFPGCEKLIPYMWMPKWCQGVTDPSARFISHYK